MGRDSSEDDGCVPNKLSFLSKSRRRAVAIKTTRKTPPPSPSQSSNALPSQPTGRTKRARGRPRKMNLSTVEKQNLEKRFDVGGIVYTDKPFRSEDLKCHLSNKPYTHTQSGGDAGN